MQNGCFCSACPLIGPKMMAIIVFIIFCFWVIVKDVLEICSKAYFVRNIIQRYGNVKVQRIKWNFFILLVVFEANICSWKITHQNKNGDKILGKFATPGLASI